jgi:hypothetical protein
MVPAPLVAIASFEMAAWPLDRIMKTLPPVVTRWSILLIRVHYHGACVADKKSSRMGRSGGGRTSKRSRALRFRLSAFALIAQIALLIAVGRGLGEIMQRIGQPSVIGELLGGLLLGPSVFGWMWPEAQNAIFPASPSRRR